MATPPGIRLSLAGALLGVACTDSAIDLDESPGATAAGAATQSGSTASGTTIDGATAGTETAADETTAAAEQPDPPQWFLLAISTDLDRELPLQALVSLSNVESLPHGVGWTTADFSLQWLSLDPGSTTDPREPIGPVLLYPAIEIPLGGSFSWELDAVTIPGTANPIDGAEVVASMRLGALTIDSDYPCGRVTGMVTEPRDAPLEDSTFAMTELTDGEPLPVDFPLACQR